MTTPIPVILSAARTPIGKFGGAFSQTPAPVLGGHAIRAAIARSGIDPAQIDEVIMGQVIQAGSGQAPARQAAIFGGAPPSTPALTINKVCGSSLKAVMMAASFIRSGEGHVYVAGGMENMNMGPYLLDNARFGYRLGHAQLRDATVLDGLIDPFHDQHMGLSAEWLAETHAISRAAQDAYALESHRRAAAATDAGHFQAEITPIPLPGKRGETLIGADEAIRRDTTAEALARLQPAFKAGGVVTAGNAPGITDGAAALVTADAAWAAAQGLTPLGRIVAQAQHALEPLRVFEAPPHAIRKAVARAGWTLAEVDLFEINEAFAAQIVHSIRELDIDPARVNIHGGAIALGHPLGASGARVLTTLLYALQARGGRRGVAALCLGGGEAVALAIETFA